MCVIKVETAVPDRQLLPSWTWPKAVIGGGFSLISSSQGIQNVANVGALVTDGHTVFALTSRHVAGPAGPGLPARRTYLTLDAALVKVAIWQDFYDALGHHASTERGLLPFRVWQFFNAMVDALAHSDLAGFIGAAGLMAHYVGDACQLLHGSVLADGLPDQTGKGVHSAYETSMIDHDAAFIVAGLPRRLDELAAHPLPFVRSGQQAAVAVVQLMDRTAIAIPPADLVAAYAATPGGKVQGRHRQAVGEVR